MPPSLAGRAASASFGVTRRHNENPETVASTSVAPGSVAPVLSAKDVTVHRGAQVVLERISLSVGPGARLGVVGPNGVGKSTLLRILAGIDAPDAGEVQRAPASLQVGYLSQEPDASPGETVRAYLARRTGVAAAGAELDRLTWALAEDPAAVDAYSDALDRFLAVGGDDFDARVGTVGADVGLPADRLDVAVTELSGGQAARVGLAAVLLARFDVFLLDEPTNDLDFAGLARLEGFLGSLPGAAVVVSHDRAFLDRAVDGVLEIDEHRHTATEYAGGWSEYIERQAVARGHQTQAYEAWAAERGRLRDRICTQRTWSEHGVKKAAKKPRDHERPSTGFSPTAPRNRRPRSANPNGPWPGWAPSRSRGRVGISSSTWPRPAAAATW
jgi:ATPase subunit of ABC transporter with duplicated ATPase domains